MTAAYEWEMRRRRGFAPPRTLDIPKDKEYVALSSLADRVKQRSRHAAASISPPLESIQDKTKADQAGPKIPISYARTAELVEGALKRKAEGSSNANSGRRSKPSPKTDLSSEMRSSTAMPTAVEKASRPFNDTLGNLKYAEETSQILKKQAKSRINTFARRQASAIHQILDKAEPTNSEEMLFLSKDEAVEWMTAGKFFEGPILTEGQQPMSLQNVDEFLEECYDDNAKVFIQDPSVRTSSVHFAREVTIGDVKKRFDKADRSKAPWNCLELATHVEDGLRPAFLNTEDCRLLTKLKIPSAQDKLGRRQYAQGYKEVEKWALLAQAGALTEPHQDSHGYSTYITVNQGHMGFGWLSFPSLEDRELWHASPSTYSGGNWRYTVLKPGQTVYFPAGTVHFVFRLPSAGNTLAFGGHVLRCSTIRHWVETLLNEKANAQISNEDLTSSAPGYLNRVEAFVDQAYRKGTLAKWGGAQEVTKFKALKYEFEQ